MPTYTKTDETSFKMSETKPVEEHYSMDYLKSQIEMMTAGLAHMQELYDKGVELGAKTTAELDK